MYYTETTRSWTSSASRNCNAQERLPVLKWHEVRRGGGVDGHGSHGRHIVAAHARPCRRGRSERRPAEIDNALTADEREAKNVHDCAVSKGSEGSTGREEVVLGGRPIDPQTTR